MCAGTELLANEAYTGDLKDLSAIEKFANQFGTTGSKAARCKGLQDKAKKDQVRRASQRASVKSLTEPQLRKKKISELREIIDDLGIPSAGLLEKGDYVSAILKASASASKGGEL